MKLTITMAAALFLCFGSFMARAAIVHHRAVQAAAIERAEAVQRTPQRESERLAMNGIEVRLGSRLHHLAQRHPRAR